MSDVSIVEMAKARQKRPPGTPRRPKQTDAPWYRRALRITTIRIVSQSVFFGLFVFFI